MGEKGVFAAALSNITLQIVILSEAKRKEVSLPYMYRFKGYWTQGQIQLWRLFASLIRLYTHKLQYNIINGYSDNISDRSSPNPNDFPAVGLQSCSCIPGQFKRNWPQNTEAG